MPDDFVLRVRQIAQYAPVGAASANLALLTQTGGIGGPYGQINAEALVATALAQSGSMQIAGDLRVGGTLTAPVIGAQAVTARELNVNLATVQDLSALNLSAAALTVGGVTAATLADVAGLAATTVRSLNGKVGNIALTVDDVMGAAPAWSPTFGGVPRAGTVWDGASDGELVTAEWVRRHMANGNVVGSFNGRRGAVRLRFTDLLEAGGAPLRSPEFMDRPTAPTPPGWDISDRIATTKWVQWALAEGGLPGPQGPKGPQGPPGTGFNFRGMVPTMAALPPAGNQVSDLFIAQDTNVGYVWTGTAWQPIGIITPSARVTVSDTAPLVAQDGDLWFSSDSGDLWVYYQGPSGGQWVIANAGVEGPQGPQGLEGPPGPNVSVGTSAPLPPQLGQLWYNPASGETQVSTSAGWRPVTPPSATVSVGTTAPAGAVEGDLWFDTNDGDLMVYLQGAWVAAATGIEGPQGPQGLQGVMGPQGLQGVMGPPGTGIQFQGDQPTLADIQALPSPNQGDGWVDMSTGDLWVWNGAAWEGPYPFGGGIPDAPTPGIFGRENGGWTQLMDDGVF